nr:MAG TPA: Doublesex protein, uba domain, dimerization, sex.6A [Caudoviricetes sp.]DAY90705.1 MAG TPA: Doublesex protein, uba domain, dimerization, sex.6A [Caudoviricetes sp.]
MRDEMVSTFLTSWEIMPQLVVIVSVEERMFV